MPSPSSFSLKPVPPFRLDLTAWALRRRPSNQIDRWDGETYRRVLVLNGHVAEVAVTQTGPPESPRLRVTLTGLRATANVRASVATALERLLGLRSNLAGFYQLAASDTHLAPLAQRFRGLKPPRFPTVFEALVNAIAGQQMSLSVCIVLVSRLTEKFGVGLESPSGTVRAFPRPEDLAKLHWTAFRRLGFSRQKGRSLISLARNCLEGKVDLERLADLSNEKAVARLLDLRGVGRWTAEYVLLRGLGRLDVYPGDDVGARNNLKRWLRLRKPLDYDGVRRVLAKWHPYAGLLYFHLLLDRLDAAGHLTPKTAELSEKEI